MGVGMTGAYEESKDFLTPVGNELASRAPFKDVIINWRLWWLFPLLLLLSIFLAASGIWLSVSHNDWSWIARFGAFISVVGSWLIARPVWRRRFKSRFSHATILTNGRYSNAQMAEYILERVDAWSFYFGFVIAALGSVIWGFGDLVNCLVSGGACPLARSF